ncbi:hypothetical protein GCM10029992_29150 [Glycomyces albus]
MSAASIWKCTSTRPERKINHSVPDGATVVLNGTLTVRPRSSPGIDSQTFLPLARLNVRYWSDLTMIWLDTRLRPRFQ